MWRQVLEEGNGARANALVFFTYARKADYDKKHPHMMGCFRHIDPDLCGQSTFAELLFLRYHPNPAADRGPQGGLPHFEKRGLWVWETVLRGEGIIKKSNAGRKAASATGPTGQLVSTQT
jgi:hypothetical protein